jgi:uncharacterized membrane protein YhiD involved in acid resistance
MLQSLLDLLNIDLNNVWANLGPVIVPLLVSTVMGFLIYFVYVRAFKGVVFNHGFSVSLALMTVLTTVVTLAISSNIALSLGMVGALSIVRYRAAIKDPMDLLFLFWAVTMGITTGARMHHLALLSAVMVILVLLFINRGDPTSKMYIIIVNYSGDEVDDELRRILRDRRYQIKSKTIRQGEVELAAEIRVNRENFAFLQNIRDLPKVNNVTLVQYNGDYNP